MKSTNDQRKNSKFYIITVGLILATICALFFNVFQIQYEYFCNTSLIKLKNTTFVNTTKQVTKHTENM